MKCTHEESDHRGIMNGKIVFRFAKTTTRIFREARQLDWHVSAQICDKSRGAIMQNGGKHERKFNEDFSCE